MKSTKPFKLYGIFGFPLAHTLSPAMQEAAFAKLDLKAYYLALEMNLIHFGEVMRGLSRLALEGFNVTVPYKEEVIRFLDGLTSEARGVGAVNTVFRKGKKWIGANTDVYGFLASLRLEGKFMPAGRNVLVMGAGGSARAVVYGLAQEKAKVIYIANRNETRARNLIRDMKVLFKKTSFKQIPFEKNAIKEALKEADLVVNATSVGLKPKDPVLIPLSLIPKASGKRRMLFFDLIYRPSYTPFLKMARARGHKIVNGLGMLLFQGAKALEYWTQKKAPVQVMKQALIKALRENSNA